MATSSSCSSSSFKLEQPLLQLQEVDSSRVVSSQVLSSPLLSSSSSPGLPVCIPSPYTDLGHDFGAVPFYAGPTIFSYAGPALPEHSPVRQTLSPTLFWPGHAHGHGHIGPPIPLNHRSMPCSQRSPHLHGSWAELSPSDSLLADSR
ncbi:hypothetical protein CRUP_032945 [Coryphaenoides rupestris]|nr:hypothetical protein CRUP_032945 [Coryphaenoides rupestris]